MSPRRRLARLVGLFALWQTINLLERMVYAAGVADGIDEAAAAAGEAFDEPRDRLTDVDEDQADDELEPADVSDVVLVHVKTFHGPDAPRAGECAC